jgi:hypothetical protein
MDQSTESITVRTEVIAPQVHFANGALIELDVAKGPNCSVTTTKPGEAPNHPVEVEHIHIPAAGLSAAGYSHFWTEKATATGTATTQQQNMRSATVATRITTPSDPPPVPAVQQHERSNDDFLPPSSSPGEALESSSSVEQDGDHQYFFDCDSSSSSNDDDDDAGGNDLDDSDDNDEGLEAGVEADLDDAVTGAPSFGSESMNKLKRIVDDNSTNDDSNVANRLADAQRAGRTQGVTSAANTTSNFAAQ